MTVPRIKVAHIIPTLVQGGAEKQMSLLVRNLDRERFDCQVVVLTHSGPLEETLRAADIPLHFVKKRGKLDPLAINRLLSILRQIQPDVVHTWLFAANSYGRLAARRLRTPVIISSERCVDPWKRWWHHRIDRYLDRFTDCIVTNSPGIQEFYCQHGASADKFVVIPNALQLPPPHPTPPDGPAAAVGTTGDASRAAQSASPPTQQQAAHQPTDPPSANAARKRITRDEFFHRFSLQPRQRLVGAVGRLWAQKGYEDLIWAGELLRVAYGDLWFVILGDGPDREKLQQYRDKVEAFDSVRFLGHREDAYELMSAFDLLWNGSLYEGQSNTILEAMSLGIPVVASDIPGNRDLVINEVTGYLYSLGDIETLIRRSNALLKDDKQRAELGRNAVERVQTEFSLEKMVTAHEQLYQELWRKKASHV